MTGVGTRYRGSNHERLLHRAKPAAAGIGNSLFRRRRQGQRRHPLRAAIRPLRRDRLPRGRLQGQRVSETRSAGGTRLHGRQAGPLAALSQERAGHAAPRPAGNPGRRGLRPRSLRAGSPRPGRRGFETLPAALPAAARAFRIHAQRDPRAPAHSRGAHPRHAPVLRPRRVPAAGNGSRRAPRRAGAAPRPAAAAARQLQLRAQERARHPARAAPARAANARRRAGQDREERAGRGFPPAFPRYFVPRDFPRPDAAGRARGAIQRRRRLRLPLPGRGIRAAGAGSAGLRLPCHHMRRHGICGIHGSPVPHRGPARRRGHRAGHAGNPNGHGLPDTVRSGE